MPKSAAMACSSQEITARTNLRILCGNSQKAAIFTKPLQIAPLSQLRKGVSPKHYKKMVEVGYLRIRKKALGAMPSSETVNRIGDVPLPP